MLDVLHVCLREVLAVAESGLWLVCEAKELLRLARRGRPEERLSPSAGSNTALCVPMRLSVAKPRSFYWGNTVER